VSHHMVEYGSKKSQHMLGSPQIESLLPVFWWMKNLIYSSTTSLNLPTRSSAREMAWAHAGCMAIWKLTKVKKKRGHLLQYRYLRSNLLTLCKSTCISKWDWTFLQEASKFANKWLVNSIQRILEAK
jgi:hypothetical protein